MGGLVLKWIPPWDLSTKSHTSQVQMGLCCKCSKFDRWFLLYLGVEEGEGAAGKGEGWRCVVVLSGGCEV